MLSDYSKQRLAERLTDASDAERALVYSTLEGLSARLEIQSWRNQVKTHEQVGYLAGLMDLEDEDRYWMLETIVGFPIYYANEPYLNWQPRKNGPGPSSKDIRITREMMSVLIDYYGNNPEALHVHDILKFQSKSSAVAERRADRLAAKAAKAAEKAAAKAAKGQQLSLST